MDGPVDGLNSRLSTANSRQRIPVIDNDDLQVVSKKMQWFHSPLLNLTAFVCQKNCLY